MLNVDLLYEYVNDYFQTRKSHADIDDIFGFQDEDTGELKELSLVRKKEIIKKTLSALYEKADDERESLMNLEPFGAIELLSWHDVMKVIFGDYRNAPVNMLIAHEMLKNPYGEVNKKKYTIIDVLHARSTLRFERILGNRPFSRWHHLDMKMALRYWGGSLRKDEAPDTRWEWLRYLDNGTYYSWLEDLPQETFVQLAQLMHEYGLGKTLYKDGNANAYRVNELLKKLAADEIPRKVDLDGFFSAIHTMPLWTRNDIAAMYGIGNIDVANKVFELFPANKERFAFSAVQKVFAWLEPMFLDRTFDSVYDWRAEWMPENTPLDL
jgi:hypothetical protein